jgi:hypothetical protein
MPRSGTGVSVEGGAGRADAGQRPSSDWLRLLALGAVTLSLALGMVLVVLHRHLGGPGDTLGYYRQAAQLIPFRDHFYGPGYMVAIRILRDLFDIEWFTSGKLVSWLSTIVIVAASFRILDRTLGRPAAWLALALLAINPLLITMSYSTWMHTFGAATVLVALAATLDVSLTRPVRWILPGVLFGLAALTRFQALGFLLGALVGGLLVTEVRIGRRMASMGVLLVSTIVPLALWRGLLLAMQGFVPENHNFIALTIPLGRYQTFFENEGLVVEYGSTWGVLTSSWSAPLRIAAYGAREFILAPKNIGIPMVWVLALLLVPGLLIAVSKRHWRAPWLGAFLAGLFLTGLAGRGWAFSFYYLPFLPFAILLIAATIQFVDSRLSSRIGRLGWIGAFVATLAWSPGQVRAGFVREDWAEQTAAKRYIESTRSDATRVSSTASSFPYDTDLPFIDQSEIMDPDETGQLVARLQEHGVTHLVITERHTLWEYPDLAYLLADTVPDVPSGLQRDTLIREPFRLAIYRVAPTESRRADSVP